MKISVDNQQRINTSLLMVLEFYKIMMATFLVLFVPQDCDGKVCTISDNFYNNDIIHFSALICNFATFMSVLGFYTIEIKREEWCIRYLDIDPSKANNNLDSEIERYPEFKEKMSKINKNYLNALYFISTLLTANFAYSGVAIVYNYDGTNTITSMVSFILLLTDKLYSSYTVGTKSVKDERAFSAYMQIARTYNTIDEDYRHDEEEKDEELKEQTPDKEVDTEEDNKKPDIMPMSHNDAGDIIQNTGNIVLDFVDGN